MHRFARSLTVWLRLLTGALLGWLTLSTAFASPPPNIVFILADDLGYGDLGCYGQSRIRTPRLDALAAQGIRFTQCYSGSTVCAPARGTLMQGLHTGHARVRGNAGQKNPLAQALRPEDITVARVLKNAGYATGLFGKWGLGDVGDAACGLPGRQGFDEFFGYLNQQHAHNYFPTHLWRHDERVPLRNVVPQESPAGAGKSSNKLEYSPDLITAEALEFVSRHHQHPFFLLFTPTLPHANNEAGREGMEIPELGPYASLDWPAPQKAHAAMVSRLDRDVGRLLDLLDQLGLADRTIVFFGSDNGPHREGGNDPTFNRSSGPLRGIKRDLYEGGIRVPMIVRWPGHTPVGKVSDSPWWFPDFLPTAAAIAHARIPAGLDGVNITPLLLGRRRPHAPRPFYWEFHEGGFAQAVRFDHWKAVRRSPSAPIELFDLDRDPAETSDLAGREPGRTARAAQLMARHHRDSSDWPVASEAAPPTAAKQR